MVAEADAGHSRSELAGNIHKEAKEDLINYLDIPEHYGFKTAVETELKVDYLVTGSWSKNAYEEAVRLLGLDYAKVVADSRKVNDGKFGKLPEESTWNLLKDHAMGYLCDNETVDGVEFPGFPKSLLPGSDGNGPILVADMFSNILSRKIPVKNFTVIFFGAQKNFGIPGITGVIIKKSLLAPITSQPDIALLRKLSLPIPSTILQNDIIAKNSSLSNIPQHL
ncbi:pyridoxal phosphate-dependent transferase [Ilyonectria sp. MPI-CAGE-AT-0026]|nr:pyridoxal phosphate-dependent transferase [Ilyonectria sp. MPI-CAGE-AT-0026]